MAGLRARIAKAHTIDDIIETHFKHLQQVIAGLAGAPRRDIEVALELALQHAIGAANLLLLAQLERVARLLARARLAVLTRARVAPLDATLRPQAALTLQK